MRNIPITSIFAYDRLKQTGKKESMDNYMSTVLTCHPGHTTHELALYAGMRDDKVQKSLSRLKKAGKAKFGVRKQCTCKVDCSNMYEWWPDSGEEDSERYFQKEMF